MKTIKNIVFKLEGASKWIGLLANTVTAIAIVFRRFEDKSEVEDEIVKRLDQDQANADSEDK